jgi:hypothetical protein
MMRAHSFHGHPSFDPASGSHGATYTCDVEFLSQELQHPELNWFVIDIQRIVKIQFKKNLDEVFS